MKWGQILSVFVLVLYTQKCRSKHSSALFKLSASGQRLTEHVISERDTLNALECSLFCLWEPSDGCKSINYKGRQHQPHSKNCQLNNATKTTHSRDLLADKDYDYYEQLMEEENNQNKAAKSKEIKEVPIATTESANKKKQIEITTARTPVALTKAPIPATSAMYAQTNKQVLVTVEKSDYETATTKPIATMTTTTESKTSPKQVETTTAPIPVTLTNALVPVTSGIYAETNKQVSTTAEKLDYKVTTTKTVGAMTITGSATTKRKLVETITGSIPVTLTNALVPTTSEIYAEMNGQVSRTAGKSDDKTATTKAVATMTTTAAKSVTTLKQVETTTAPIPIALTNAPIPATSGIYAETNKQVSTTTEKLDDKFTTTKTVGAMTITESATTKKKLVETTTGPLPVTLTKAPIPATTGIYAEMNGQVSTKAAEKSDYIATTNKAFSTMTTSLNLAATTASVIALATCQVPVTYAKNCDALYKSGKTTSGIYTIDPDGQDAAFPVRCDMMPARGRGWTIFQRRVDGSENFYRNWTDYKIGFGNLNGEFWLGLDRIHRLTASGQSVIRVDLVTFENETAYAEYRSFTVANERELYRLNFNISSYAGTAGNSLRENKMNFTTVDADNDITSGSNCAQKYHGAWWFSNCGYSHLNGEYLGGPHNNWGRGIFWSSFKGFGYSHKLSEMKLGANDG